MNYIIPFSSSSVKKEGSLHPDIINYATEIPEEGF